MIFATITSIILHRLLLSSARWWAHGWRSRDANDNPICNQPRHLPMSPDVKTHIHELSQRADLITPITYG